VSFTLGNIKGMNKSRYFPDFRSLRAWVLLILVIAGIGVSVILLSNIFYWGILIYPAILLFTSIGFPMLISRGGFFYSVLFALGLFISAKLLGEGSEPIDLTEVAILVTAPIIISLSATFIHSKLRAE
jgi:hypothetical protein